MVTVGGIKIHCRNLYQSAPGPGLHPVRETTSQHLTDSDNGSLRLIDKLGGRNKKYFEKNIKYFQVWLCSSAYTDVSTVMFQILCWWNHLSLAEAGGVIREWCILQLLQSNTAQVPPTTSHLTHLSVCWGCWVDFWENFSWLHCWQNYNFPLACSHAGYSRSGTYWNRCEVIIRISFTVLIFHHYNWTR